MQQTVSFLILVHIQVSIFAISDVYNASRKLLCTFCNGKTKWYIPSLKRNYLWYSSIDVILTRFYFTQFYSAIHVLLTFFFVWVLDDDKEFASENSRINLKCGMNKKLNCNFNKKILKIFCTWLSSYGCLFLTGQISRHV